MLMVSGSWPTSSPVSATLCAADAGLEVGHEPRSWLQAVEGRGLCPVTPRSGQNKKSFSRPMGQSDLVGKRSRADVTQFVRDYLTRAVAP